MTGKQTTVEQHELNYGDSFSKQSRHSNHCCTATLKFSWKYVTDCLIRALSYSLGVVLDRVFQKTESIGYTDTQEIRFIFKELSYMIMGLTSSKSIGQTSMLETQGGELVLWS
jgi:hypothetical protein